MMSDIQISVGSGFGYVQCSILKIKLVFCANCHTWNARQPADPTASDGPETPHGLHPDSQAMKVFSDGKMYITNTLCYAGQCTWYA